MMGLGNKIAEQIVNRAGQRRLKAVRLVDCLGYASIFHIPLSNDFVFRSNFNIVLNHLPNRADRLLSELDGLSDVSILRVF